MSDFTASRCSNGRFDARKRINYALGLVLGGDDLGQEQFYLRERDHRAVRALHGSGTVAGLTVAVDGDQVKVKPGLAVDAAGRLICVPAEQCADLGDWLTRRHDDVVAQLGSLPELALYVVLCYRECETDKVPLPSDPCQSDEESMAASRVTDGFELRLAFAPPAATGELAGGLLRPVVDALTDPLVDSPPDQPAGLDDVRGQVADWVLRNRPELGTRPCLGPGEDTCVLLARLDLTLELGDDGRLTLTDPATADDDDRPLLLSTRFLQEWLMRLTARETEEIRFLDDLEDVDTGGAATDDVLTFDNGLWLPRPLSVRDHGSLLGLEDDDHLQYVPADGSRPLTGELDAGGHRLTLLGNAVDAQDALTLGQLGDVVREGDTAGGDLSGNYRNPSVAQLQGRPVADEDPPDGFALVWENGAWRPRQVAGAVQHLLPFATITPLGAQTLYEIWFNLEAPKNPVAVTEEFIGAMQVFAEIEDPAQAFLEPLDHDLDAVLFRNVFRVVVARPAAGRGWLRFVFALGGIKLDSGQTVAEYRTANGVAYEGAGDEDSVTRLVRDSKLVEG